MSVTVLCRLTELPEGSCREFSLAGRDVFVLHHAGQLRAYVNTCPHTGVSLNWLPNQFFNLEGDYLQCATHGALFRIEDGYCVRGPCAGASLQAIPIALVDGCITCPGIDDN